MQCKGVVEGKRALTCRSGMIVSVEMLYYRSSQDSSLLHAHLEIQHLRQSLWSLENQLEASRTNDHLLQALLQEAYKQEWENLKRRKQSAEEEMAKAQRVVSLGGRGYHWEYLISESFEVM